MSVPVLTLNLAPRPSLWRQQHPELTCFIEGFSNEMHLLMQASDAVVTRGGTTTCAKADRQAREIALVCAIALIAYSARLGSSFPYLSFPPYQVGSSSPTNPS